MRNKKRMKPFTKVFTAIFGAVCILSACAVDSDTYIPLITMSVSMLYLIIVGARYGIFEESGDY